MRGRLVAAAFVALAGTPAHADDTFAAGAQRVKHVDDIVWALTASCDQGDDTQNRQCRKLRDGRAAELANTTLLVEADRNAFNIGAWSAQKKSVPLSLDACIRCGGIEVGGKTWFVVGTKDGVAATWKGAKLVAGTLHDNARTFGDDASAKAWSQAAEKSTVQLLVKVGPKAKQNIENKNVIALDVIGYRVFSPCDGSVVFANPKSDTVVVDKADKKACAANGGGAPSGEAIDALTPAMISQTMKPIAEQAAQCGTKHGVHGDGKVKLTVAADGTVVGVEQIGAFANTKAGECIEALAKQASFPRSKKEKTVFSYPIKLP